MISLLNVNLPEKTYRKNARSVDACKAQLTKRHGTYQCKIDLSLLVGDNLATVNQLDQFLRQNMKVNNRLMSSKYVIIEADDNSLSISIRHQFSNNNMRYYLKKWLHRMQMRDLTRVVMKGSKTFAFQYYQTSADLQDLEE
ncbi:MAG: hypothetical protein MHPSP_003549 [Paramarteilia canceri]